MENQNLNWIERLNDILSRSISVKLFSITFLILLLLIPKEMINSLIIERESTMKAAIEDVSGKWSGSQLVAGPVLIIPYLYSWVSETGKVQQMKKFAYFLPDKLDIQSHVNPEKRYRGIYSIIVYKASISLAGTYSIPDFTSFGIDNKDVLWSQSSLQIGIDDLRGIEDNVVLQWNDGKFNFNPGNTDKQLFHSGISAILPLDSKEKFNAEFKIDLSLRGSQNLYFIPVGKETNASMTSPWDAPSFIGSFLPESRTVNNDGFNAKWKILHFNRNYPQQWTGEEQSFAHSEFGVYFLVPMDQYLKSLRSSKYSILVIALTFLVFFLVEIMMKQRIHPIQYVLVGLSLSLFYVLLLSISEQIGFDLSYMIASVMIILLIYLYSRTIVKNMRAALLMLLFLVLNYGFIYVIIQLEEYSLLVGSLGLFVALSITMFVTRKINWYGNKD